MSQMVQKRQNSATVAQSYANSKKRGENVSQKYSYNNCYFRKPTVVLSRSGQRYCNKFNI